MKETYSGQVPVEQYGYIAFEGVDSLENAKMAYSAIKQAYTSNVLPSVFYKQIQAIIDSDLGEGWGSPDNYANMSKEQQDLMQSLKRLKKRLNYREE